jgi:hypothetical protein
MIPVVQRISASGGDSTLPGDCVKCCVASIFDLPYEAVPHFVAREVKGADGEPLNWDLGLNHWLRESGYPLYFKDWRNRKTGTEVRAERERLGLKPGESMPANLMYRASEHPDECDGYWIASVISENFENSTHAIVMLDRRVAFDPSPHPRRTPYAFIGWGIFVATDPVLCRARADRTAQ